MFKKIRELQKEIESFENFENEESDDYVELANSPNLKEFDSEKLCDIVIAYRYLGSNKEFSVKAMSELAERRSQGNSFNYEEYIEKNLKELPSLKFDFKDLEGFIGTIKKYFK